MTIFVVRGQGMTMVINRKKGKFENFDQSICYVPQKKAKNM